MLLGIETATDVCSVALVRHGELCATSEILRPRSHSEQLLPLIHDMLDREGATAKQVKAVAVSSGPGSYTGLRIGVSAAKGICVATGADLVGIPTLTALARQAGGLLGMQDIVVAALQSRRGEVYVAAFRMGLTGIEPLAEAAALALDELAPWIPATSGLTWVLGPAGATVAEHIETKFCFLDAVRFRPRAESVAELGWTRWVAGEVEDMAAFEPAYLKPFETRAPRSIL